MIMDFDTRYVIDSGRFQMSAMNRSLYRQSVKDHRHWEETGKVIVVKAELVVIYPSFGVIVCEVPTTDIHVNEVDPVERVGLLSRTCRAC